MFGMINMMNQGAINRQQGMFTNRLVDGAKSGQLNKSEFMSLENYDQQTKELEGQFLKDGNMSWQERQILEQRNSYNQQMLSLYSMGDFKPGTQAPQNEVEARMQNQLSRTYDGLQDGSLTRGEGVGTLNVQGGTAIDYGRMQGINNSFGIGNLTPGERFALNNRLNASSQQIFNMRHNWSSDFGAPQNVPQFQPYTPPFNFPRMPMPSMMGGQPPSYPGFPGGGCPPYLSQFTQGMFNMMSMGMMMGMMGGMGFGMPLEMFGGGMPMAMQAFMGMPGMMGMMNPMMGMMNPMMGMMNPMMGGMGNFGAYPGAGAYATGGYGSSGAYAGASPYGSFAGAYSSGGGAYAGAGPYGAYAGVGGSGGSGQAAVDIGRRFLGQNSIDIRGQLPHFTAAGGQTNDCADFVSSCLESSGRIQGHHVNVRELEQSLLRQGWRQIPASQARPGDVWMNESRGHTELVQGFDPQRGLRLIGSNNDRPGHQRVSESGARGGVVYTRA